jgi:hypothetical protein
MGNKASKLFAKVKIRSLEDQINEKHREGVSLSGDSSNEKHPRYDACTLLAKFGFSNVIWFEDLLALHGSDTRVWDLNLLVKDPNQAAEQLVKAGYRRMPPDNHLEYIPEITQRGVRVIKSETAVVLLPAEDWYYDLEAAVSDHLPPIHAFLDSMADVWLRISSQDYADRLRFAMYLACMISYCYSLVDTHGVRVKSIEFAEKLKPEHRELHYDIISSGSRKESFDHAARHQYHVRRSREIREGMFSPVPYQDGAFQPTLTTLTE